MWSLTLSPGRPWQVMDNAVLNRVWALLNNYAHWWPDMYVRKGSWLNGPAFLPRATSAVKVFTNHRPIVHGQFPVPWPNCFPLTLVSYIHLLTNTLQQALTPVPVRLAGQIAAGSYWGWEATVPAGQHSEAGCSCLQCLQTWALLQLGKVHEFDWYLMLLQLGKVHVFHWYLMQISLPWWKTGGNWEPEPQERECCCRYLCWFPWPSWPWAAFLNARSFSSRDPWGKGTVDNLVNKALACQKHLWADALAVIASSVVTYSCCSKVLNGSPWMAHLCQNCAL